MATPPPEYIRDRLWGPNTAFPSFLGEFSLSLDNVVRNDSEPRWLTMGHLNLISWLAQSIFHGIPNGPTRDLLFGLLRHIYTSGCVGWLTANAGFPMESRGIGRSLLETSWLFELGCEDPSYLQNWWHQMQLPTGGRLRGKLLAHDRNRYGREKATAIDEAREEMYKEWSAGAHPSFFAIIVPWEFDHENQKSFMRFGRVTDEFAVRRGEEHFLMLIDAVASICTQRAVACFPDMPDREDLLPAMGMLQSAFLEFSKRIREELETPTVIDPAELSRYLRLWDDGTTVQAEKRREEKG